MLLSTKEELKGICKSIAKIRNESHNGVAIMAYEEALTIIQDRLTEEDTDTVCVQRMYRFETERALKAFADIIINDVLLIKGVRVMDSKKGLMVSMPREQAKDQKWYDTIRCMTPEMRDKIQAVVLEAYNEE